MADRVLRMRLVYSRQNVLPNASFEFQNRQLAWHAFTVRCAGGRARASARTAQVAPVPLFSRPLPPAAAAVTP